MRNLLFVTCHLPYPVTSGGRRREYELVTRLARERDVHLLTFTETYEEDLEHSDFFEDLCASVTVAPVRCSDHRVYPSEVRRHANRDGRAIVSKILDENAIELIHVESFYLMQHVPEQTRLPIFLQEQNVEYLLWKQRAETARHPEVKADAMWEYLRTIEAETRAWQRASLCGAVTREDLAVMEEAVSSAHVRLVPNGFDHLPAGAVRPRSAKDGATGRVVFVANFAYQPNVDAALYLGEAIWPLVTRRVPTAQLLLVGNAPPPGVQALEMEFPTVRVTGRVPDVTPYLDLADVVVCPLRIGGGIKVKVLEALSRGKAIVTTTTGAQGISFPERSMRVVDAPSAFAEATVELLRREDLRHDLEDKARLATQELPTWEDAAMALTSSYRELLGAPQRLRSPGAD
jgi:glycosyltransferase involved in cell wall biosynthesis